MSFLAERGGVGEISRLPFGHEAAARLGGVLVTERIDDCIVEAGPDSFLTEKTWGSDFVRSLGLGDQLIGSKIVPLPDNGEVHITGCEIFLHHPKDGGSS